jgi:hypothetical protein
MRFPLVSTVEPTPGIGSPIRAPSGRMRTKWRLLSATMVPSSAIDGDV